MLLREDDQTILDSLDLLRNEALEAGCPALERGLYATRRAVEDRLRQLNGQAAALANANVHGAELLAEVEAFGEQIRAQNATLAAHAAKLEASQKDAERLVRAMAESNALAAMELAESDERQASLERTKGAVLAERESIAREAEELRRQSAALAAANVEMLLVAEERAAQVSDLKARCEQERSEKAMFREQALLDGLTGLYNRRYYDEQLRSEHARATRHKRDLSVVFVDIDHFKHFNDENGHDAGDQLLARVGRLLRSAVRGSDVVARGEGTPFAARYGGEEFILILPETPLRGAAVVAERVRRTIEETSFAGAESQPGGRVTVSVGVAALSPGDAHGSDVARRADAALYRAKGAGRNRVVLLEAEADAA